MTRGSRHRAFRRALHELAREHRVSAERTRQLEAKALEQMKGALVA
jgi:DNA-directed RNA polymerase sigma subunit (sigma70/sigma32)